MGIQPAIYPLRGRVQPYAWGGHDFIADLLGSEKTGKPAAEYWLGAHASNPAQVAVHGHLKNLDALIHDEPEAVLGGRVAQQFGTLPYLLKVLDVRQMLSIQVHPDKASAAAAFAAENGAGIAPEAPHRNYKDANHKPELMAALSDFWLLHGFKPMAKLEQTLEAIPPFSFLIPALNNGGYRGLYEHVMTLPQADVNAVLEPLLAQLLPLYHNGELLKSSADFWAARAAETFCKGGNYDRGIFSIYFFNLVFLKKGEGIYQPAGLPHAYLEGQNIEIMAASDNVLRAGLTDKHIDIAELMKHVRFEETIPLVLQATQEKDQVYQSGAAEFELHRIQLKEGDRLEWKTETAEIVLQVAGETSAASGENTITLHKGEAVFITAGAAVTLQSNTATQIFRATVPQS